MAWVYTGGWGGAHYKPSHSSTAPGSIRPMSDMKYFYIYENQRWNQLSGFSISGLPTDRLYVKRRFILFVKPESEVPKSGPKGLGLTLKSCGPPTHHPPHNF